MFTKENFKFDHVEDTSEYTDYWFKTDKTSENELMSEYMEQGMVGIPFVIYSKKEDIIAIRRQFMFNFDFITPTDDELKSILADMVKDMQQEACDLCGEIYDEEELRNMHWSKREYSNYITHNEKYGSYHLWHECDDSYYSGIIMEIKYCPVCGRKLSDV